MSGNKAQRKKRKKQRKRKQPKTRNAQRTTSYSTMTIQGAEHRLGFRFGFLTSIPVGVVLANAKHNFEGLDKDMISSTKEKVYERIVEYLEIEGTPTQAKADFKEANVSDLVYSIISPIFHNYIA
jgi:ribosome assembly protein YihI (activator of Der GTPase)